MMHSCAVWQEPGIRPVCELLGAEEINGNSSGGLTLALREIVEHFHIRWELTPHQNTYSEKGIQIGLAIELKGTHEPAAHHTGLTCWHCTNLMLGLRIIGDWILPPEGKCSFCEVQVFTNFVHGDQQGQRENCTTRTIRLASRVGDRIQVEACHIWCMKKIKERLSSWLRPTATETEAVLTVT